MGRSSLHIVRSASENAISSVHLGRRLRELRTERGLSQETAAVRAGMSRNTLARHELSAFPDLKLSTMLALMELYDVPTLDALVGASPVQALLHAWVDEGRPGLRGQFVGSSKGT
jgi:transcriptional regulator with XRE-family HTH domain